MKGGDKKKSEIFEKNKTKHKKQCNLLRGINQI